jgi:hypothetical protein
VTVLILVGTRKGLFQLEGDEGRCSWTVQEPALTGWEVFQAGRGVYRSDDRGENWERLDGNGLPNAFGFGSRCTPRDADTAYVIPEGGAENRVTSGGRLGVYRTRDAGATWELLTGGLPQQAWTGVLRKGMALDTLDPVGVYFGTQSGSVYVTPDEGETWVEAASQLPPILSVEVAVSPWWPRWCCPICWRRRPAGRSASKPRAGRDGGGGAARAAGREPAVRRARHAAATRQCLRRRRGNARDRRPGDGDRRRARGGVVAAVAGG